MHFSKPGLSSTHLLHKAEHSGIVPPKSLSEFQLGETKRLTTELCSSLAAEFCVRRNISDSHSFLNTSLDHLPSPFEISGISNACGIILKHFPNPRTKRAFIACDFDVDGVSSASIVHSALSALGFDIEARTPCRQREGYGFNARLLREAKQFSASVLFLLDFGTQQKQLVAEAKRSGIDVIIIDHHLAEGLPVAEPTALINPHHHGCEEQPSPGRLMCAAGLCERFCSGLASTFSSVDFHKEEWLALAALATKADVVPLTCENRALLKFGKPYLTNHTGCAALIAKLGLRDEITDSDLAFRLAPILNAPGRIVENGGNLALQQLISSAKTGSDLSHQSELLINCNHARQNREQHDLALAESIIASRSLGPAIVVADDRFDPGVAGLVAARLLERYQRPAVVVSLCERDGGRASVRGVANFHVYNALYNCREYLIRFGGHTAAGGFTISSDNVAKFAAAFCRFAQTTLGDFTSQLVQADFITSIKELSEDAPRLMSQLRVCEPYGAANFPPVWYVANATLRRVTEIGAQHLLLKFTDGEVSIPAYIFNNPRHPAVGRIGETFNLGIRLSLARLSNEGGRSAPLFELVGMS